MTISIDGPGVYSEYPADGEASLPFNCSTAHTYLLTAHASNGRTATRTVTLEPRNAQQPEDDSVQDLMAASAVRQTRPTGSAPRPVGVSGEASRLQGASTGDGTATDADCEAYAEFIGSTVSEAVAAIEVDDVEKGAYLLDEADRYRDQGMSAGCFFFV